MPCSSKVSILNIISCFFFLLLSLYISYCFNKTLSFTMALIDALLTAWAENPLSATMAIGVLSLFLYEAMRPKLCFEVYHKSPKLPLIGARRGEWFPRMRAIWRNAMDIKTATEEAYKYKDQACILPIIDIGDVVMIPPSEAPWLAQVPEDHMSTHFQQLNTFQLKFTITDPRLVADTMPIHEVLIGSSLTRETNSLLPVMTIEVAKQIDAILGIKPGASQSVVLMDSLPTVISRVANCAFVGPKMCANSALVDASMRFAKGAGFTSVLLRCSPQVLRPLVSLLTTGPQKRAEHQFYKELGPEVRRRMDILLSAGSDAHSEDKGSEKQNDFLQWLIEAAVECGDAYMMKPETIMGRILLVNFVSIHISSMVLAQVLFDLASSSPKYIDELRSEIVAALIKYDGVFDKKAINEMPKLDSTFRESQRINSIVTIASPRPVCIREGVTTPSGVHLPYGTTAAVLSYPILHDPELYPDPETFKPFRFFERRTEAAGNGESLEKLRQNWISVTSTYTAFGTGKHACPGRFFASNMLKITLAYILLTYNITPLDERPKNDMFSVAILPSAKGRVEFTRRETPFFRWEDVDTEW